METQQPARRSVFFQAGVPARFEIGKDGESYPTQIEEVGESTLLLLAPLKGDEVLSLRERSEVVLVVDRRNNPYFFDVTVLDAIQAEGKAFVKVTRPADNAARQLREVVRIPVLLEAQLWLLDEQGLTHGAPLKATILDLSQGGALVLLRDKCEVGNQLLMRLQLGKGGDRVALNGTIRRVNTVTANNLQSYRYGIQFERLDRKLQEQIAKYVIQRERELLRQGSMSR